MSEKPLSAPAPSHWKKWARRVFVGIAMFAILAGIAYEASTHVIRGWLRGEAFYDGRPTSYWRPKCDEWLERFDDQYSFEMSTWLISFEHKEAPGARRLAPPNLNHEGQNWHFSGPKSTYFTRVRDSLRSKTDLEHDKQFEFAPKILWGTPDTQPVLEELAAEEKYRPLAKIALGRVEKIKVHYAEFLKEQADVR
jgi:hypothetical protein